jgi:hypothetical protein
MENKMVRITKGDFENADREYMTVEMYPIGSAVDKMYGINVVQLTKKETKELLEGKFLYISDEEYATCIRLYKEGKDE